MPSACLDYSKHHARARWEESGGTLGGLEVQLSAVQYAGGAPLPIDVPRRVVSTAWMGERELLMDWRVQARAGAWTI